MPERKLTKNHVVFTQDQLDKQAREQGRIRVVPLKMRDVSYDDERSLYYTDRIKSFAKRMNAPN